MRTKIFVYLDESGSIHKNSKTKYFAVGGYFSTEEARLKILSSFKKINKKIKLKNNISLNTEIKSYEYTNDNKKDIFNIIQYIKGFKGCVKVFDKSLMKKEITSSNIFFNYAVKLLLIDCILPSVKLSTPINFIISIDTRNISVGELNDLEKYLKTEFCMYDINFEITYYDSKTNYNIQLADLIVNTFYNRYKDMDLVSEVIETINMNNFNVSEFLFNKKD